MNSAIKAVEIWKADQEGYLLEHDGGLYGDALEFEAVSRDLVFGRGEGLPGRVWETGGPVLLPSLDGAGFRRAKSARKAGYAAAVAWPYHGGDRIVAVAVLFFGAAATGTLAVDLWSGAPRARWTDGFGGVPGEARTPPVDALDLGAWAGVLDLDAEAAMAAPLARGSARPSLSMASDDGAGVTHLLTVVSSIPLAARVEGWSLDEDRTLRRTAGEPDDAAIAEQQEALLLEAFGARVPRMAATDHGHGLIALPLRRDGAPDEVLLLGC